MFSLGPLGFTAPWLLLGLLALPLLWLVLRAVPPAPLRQRFPAVALLLGLEDQSQQTARTPWWLLLLRSLIAAAVLIGFAGPILNPGQRPASGNGPLLILVDATWADARDWEARVTRMNEALDEATAFGRPTALVALTNLPPDAPVFTGADAQRSALTALTPRPWQPSAAELAAFAETLEGSFETLWLSDGLDRAGKAALVATLQDHGPVTIIDTPRQHYALRAPVLVDGKMVVTLLRSPATSATEATLTVIGRDPNGAERILAQIPAPFAAGEGQIDIPLTLEPELLNRLTRLDIAGQASAAAVALPDDALRRREIGLLAGGSTRGEQGELLSPLHYLREALRPSADLLTNLALADMLPANPDAIIMADVSPIPPADAEALQAWVEAGGLLVRFAGPRLAASEINPMIEDPLLPVRLRAGGRTLGGTMSWGDPKTIAPFAEDSPFYGLTPPDDVTVTAQVMAQPDPDLASRTIAQLTDGTPLVTRKNLGAGQVVLFHVTANPDWSNMVLSGLFVQMLERLALGAGGPRGDAATDLAGTTWLPVQLLDATGRLTPTDTAPPVTGEVMAAGQVGPTLPPGLYASDGKALAVNVMGPQDQLSPAIWPASVTVETAGGAAPRALGGWLLGLALALLAVDSLTSLWLSGRMRRGAAAMLALLIALPVPDAQAQPDPAYEALALAATTDVVLAHVLSGDPRIDQMAQAGLAGLGQTLRARTSIEPAAPMGIDIEVDEISFFPFLYWPVTANSAIPSAAAYQKLNRYLQSGGMILFDTRDADLAGGRSSTPEGRALQAIAAGLDIPPLAPVPADHVLTRTFYILQDFPGRFNSTDIWVEAPPPDADTVEGMPFRNLNDGVTPVVIGGNDWASAWATNDLGQALVPIGRGAGAERQREMAHRFGVNLIMHVLTGNYKSDQVHVPALLERLGEE